MAMPVVSMEMTGIVLPPGAVELRTWSARSALPMSGGGAIPLGALFLAGGIGIIARATLGGMQGMHAPRGVVALAGVSFALVGLYILLVGIADRRRRAATAARRDAAPAEPWRWDHAWREDGIDADFGRDVARSFGAALFIAIFLPPFHWIGFFAPDRMLVFGIGALLFDGVIVWMVVRGVRAVMIRRRYGRSWLRFERFPFRPGQPLEASLDSFGELSLIPRLTATLRCIQERYEERGSGKNRSTQVVCYALWSETKPVERDRKGFFRIAFDLPATASGCTLSERPARFWELELKSDDVPGLDYEARFLVPVY